MLKPPAVSPNGDEVKAAAEILAVEGVLDDAAAVVEILKSDDYDSPQDMATALVGSKGKSRLARALVAKAYEMLLRRDWWAIVWEPDVGHTPPAYLTYGFYSTAQAAEKALQAPEKLGMGGGRAMVLKVRSAADRLEYVADELDLVRVPTVCANCDHQKAAHEHPRYNGRCMGQGCKCKAFVESKKGK